MGEHQITRAQLLKELGFGPDTMRKIKICRVCGCSCNSEEIHCKDCGAVLPKDTLFDFYRSQHLSCPVCDTVVPKKTRFCPHCGRQLWREVVLPSTIHREQESENPAPPKAQSKFIRFLRPLAVWKAFGRSDDQV